MKVHRGGYTTHPTFIFRGSNRLRLRKASWFYMPVGALRFGGRRWEVTFDRGPVWYTAGGRSFSWSVLRAVAGVYWRSWRQRHRRVKKPSASERRDYTGGSGKTS